MKFSSYFYDYGCKYIRFVRVLDQNQVEPGDFNIGHTFPVLGVEPKYDKKPNLKLLTDFICDVWANGDRNRYSYILGWFRSVVCNLNDINKTALVMISEQGCGKDTLVDFLNFMLGPENILRETGISNIVQKHNTLIQGKRLVVVNEMASTREEFRSNFDKLKSYISDSTIRIEPKGINSYTVKNVSNFIMFSNHSDSIIVEGTDWRYAIFELSTKYRNNREYFGEIRKKCFNLDTAVHFYEFLCNMKPIDLFEIPSSSLREDAKRMSEPSWKVFLKQVKEERQPQEIQEEDPESEITEFVDEQPLVGRSIRYVTAMRLYQVYRDWCQKTRMNEISSVKFGVNVKNYMVSKRSNGIKYDLDSINFDK